MQGWLLTACCDPSAQGTRSPLTSTSPSKPGRPALTHRPGWAGLGCPSDPHSCLALSLTFTPRAAVLGRWGGSSGGEWRGVSTPHLGLQWARGVPTAPGCQED